MSEEKSSENKGICANITSLMKKYCGTTTTQVGTLCKKYFCPSQKVKEEQKTELNEPEPSSEKVSIIHEEEPISVIPEEESRDIHDEGSVISESMAIDIEQSLSKKNSGKRSKKPNVDEI
jgi:hypothetical protein